MQVFFVLVAMLALIVELASIVMYFVSRAQHNIPKRKKWRNIFLGSIAAFVICCVGSGLTGRSDAGGDTHHANHAQIVEDRRKKAKKAAKASSESKAKAKKKTTKKPKVSSAQKKRNLANLKKLLANMPHKTDHAIVKAYVGDGNLDINVVLNDNLLDQSDAMLRKDCKEVWQGATNLAYASGPFPSGTIDYTEPLVYVKDSAGDELGRTNMWGSFKWEGK